MSISNIDAVLNPRSVAIVGASDDLNKWGGGILALVRRFGFKGQIYPVNPKGGSIKGLQAYASVAEINAPVDMVVLAVPQERSLAAVEDCARAKAKAVLMFTSQFAESGEAGERLQEQISSVARNAGIRIVGPNCMGYFNSHADLNLLNAQAFLKYDHLIQGDIALISQSGALAGVMLARAYKIGIGFSICVSVGNQADLEICDFLEYAISDPQSKSILLYVEGLKSPQRFMTLLRQAKAAGKPVLLMKAGRTAAGTRAVQSHTASMAGEYAAFEASVRDAGVAMVDDFLDMITFASAWRSLPAPTGPAVGVLSGSGGGGAVTSDLVSEAGLPLAELSEATIATVTDLMPAANAHLPFDAGAVPAPMMASRPDWFEEALTRLMREPAIGAGLYLMTTQVRMKASALSVHAVSAKVGKPLMFVNATSDVGADATVAYQAAGGVAFESVEQALRYHACRLRQMEDTNRVPDMSPPLDVAPARAVLTHFKPGLLTEDQSKALLASVGVRVPGSALVNTVDDAVKQASAIGYPVVMKLVSPQITHKSDVGGVILNVDSDAAVRAAFAQLQQAAAKVKGAVFEGSLIQEMVRADVEFLAGTHFDPQFGPMLMFGFGGTLVELQRDTALLPATASKASIDKAITELKMFPLLDGYRGRQRVDRAALVDCIWRIGQLALHLGEQLQECEANPLMLRGSSIVAADARAVWKE